MSCRFEVPALEAVTQVAAEYGLQRADLKSCIAVVLDGNIGGAARHEAAFVIAVECRRMGLDATACARVLRVWARKVAYREHEAQRAIRNAYQRTSNGDWKYYAPGLTKKPGTTYHRVLAQTCEDVGCPANCLPFQGLRQGLKAETFGRFEALGWSAALRRLRRNAAIDTYRAICEIERQRGFAPGSPLFTSYKDLAKLTDRDQSGFRQVLQDLHRASLLATLILGSGSGPYARDKQATRLTRTVPIPSPSPELVAAIKNRSRATTQIDGTPQPKDLDGAPPPDIGGTAEAA